MVELEEQTADKIRGVLIDFEVFTTSHTVRRTNNR